MGSVRKNLRFLLLAAALGSFPAPALTASQLNSPTVGISQAPDRKPAAAPKAPEWKNQHGKDAVPQSDAFETAAEQAAFMGAYQMWLGPYGTKQDKKKREKLLKETAAAIQACIHGNCPAEQQETVLKALVQYNVGMDIKRMMLQNSTNRERMRSMEEKATDAQGRPLLDQAAIEKSLRTGRSFSLAPADKKRTVNDTELLQRTGKKEEFQSRISGTAKAPYFQLDESQVDHRFSGPSANVLTQKEREILGEDFFKEYGLVARFDPNEREAAEQRYKARFFAHKNKESGAVFDDSQGGFRVADEKRMDELRKEQESPQVQKAVADYRQKLKDSPLEIMGSGQAKVRFTDENDPEKIGVGTVQEIDPEQVPELGLENLRDPITGKMSRAAKAKAATRYLNRAFQASAEEKIKSSQQRQPSAAHSPAIDSVNLHLDADRFGQFLDEIWPSSAKRREILSK